MNNPDTTPEAEAEAEAKTHTIRHETRWCALTMPDAKPYEFRAFSRTYGELVYEDLRDRAYEVYQRDALHAAAIARELVSTATPERRTRTAQRMPKEPQRYAFVWEL